MVGDVTRYSLSLICSSTGVKHDHHPWLELKLKGSTVSVQGSYDHQLMSALPPWLSNTACSSHTETLPANSVCKAAQPGLGSSTCTTYNNYVCFNSLPSNAHSHACTLVHILMSSPRWQADRQTPLGLTCMYMPLTDAHFKICIMFTHIHTCNMYPSEHKLVGCVWEFLAVHNSPLDH